MLFMLDDLCYILVGGDWNMFYFPIQLGMSSSQLTNLYFSEGWLNHQPAFNPVQFRLADLRPVHGLSFDDAIQPIMDSEGRAATSGVRLDVAIQQIEK